MHMWHVRVARHNPGMKKFKRWGLVVVALLVVGGVLWWTYFYAAAAVFYLWGAPQASSQASVQLHRYHAVVQAKPVAGIKQNLSGLTFDRETGTLFGIANGPSRIVQLSTAGETLRVIKLRGGKDTEAIAHLGGTHFLVVDESTNALWQIEILSHTQEIVLEGEPSAQLALEASHSNLGIEAMAWSARRRTLWVGLEKWPMRVQELQGHWPVVQHVPAPSPQALREWAWHGWGGWLMRDLAAMTHMGHSGHLLMLSQESGVVVEYDVEGKALGILPLWRGVQGLKKAIPQPEGMAMDPDGNLYIVSEPNLFYRFEKSAPPG